MPWGGRIHVRRDGDHWQISGEAEKMKIDPALWEMLTTPKDSTDIPPAQVHFALIAPELARQNRSAGVTISDHSISVEY